MIKNLCVLIFTILGSSLYAQQKDCKVNLPAISGTYSGECKKGLAQGNGIAQGVDRYEGEFFKGLPDGKGKYTWANGTYYEGEWKRGMREGAGKMVSADSVITGYWKANEFKGEKPGPSYRIKTSRNVARSTLYKTNEPGNGVKIRILLGGSDNSEVEDFSLAYSSGIEYKYPSVYGLQNVSLPLSVIVRYRTWNQLHTAQYDVLFEFEIFDPGVWDVRITNM